MGRAEISPEKKVSGGRFVQPRTVSLVFRVKSSSPSQCFLFAPQHPYAFTTLCFFSATLAGPVRLNNVMLNNVMSHVSGLVSQKLHVGWEASPVERWNDLAEMFNTVRISNEDICTEDIWIDPFAIWLIYSVLANCPFGSNLALFIFILSLVSSMFVLALIM
jgi:hypothetical protein